MRAMDRASMPSHQATHDNQPFINGDVCHSTPWACAIRTKDTQDTTLVTDVVLSSEEFLTDDLY